MGENVCVVTIWTIGHSNRGWEEFLELLRTNEIGCLVDVRAFPGSRKHPQFGKDEFAGRLEAAGIEYVHERRLGGRRKLERDTGVGGAWRNLSFRAYAEYTRTREFRTAIDDLVQRASQQRVVICCSEAVPWRCHRWIVSDVLAARGEEVRHIVGPAAPKLHSPASFAVIEAGDVTWPAEQQTLPVELPGERLQQDVIPPR
jgi:uncharacterized protein (DUF488 family)